MIINLYLAEDQNMLNSALTQLLELEDDFHVVGSATNGASAWNDLQKLEIDVAIFTRIFSIIAKTKSSSLE
ncbi:hypothetical protein FD21_GL001872 [Liquorilactobacillus vini DSM 20605]|uniref:Response regulatory domain-containing protein n=1 Tax=Liquorilactobacillus vini DSM 20605 TaxID=1133569 RepID=A0A0R2C076_9LACO|nr:hypothetical protein FD21_GL001872 [Liquorilactobacillus vini DSM 20605]